MPKSQSQSQTKKFPIRNFAIFIVAFLVIGMVLGPNAGQVYTGISATGSDTVELTNNGNLDTKVRDFSITSGMELDVRPVTITNSGIVLSDYQDEIGVSHVDGMESDYSDVYFTDSDGNLLSFWLKPGYTSSNAVVFVKVPTVPVGESVITMKYDDVVTGASSGTDTHIQYHGAATSNFLDDLVLSAPFVYEARVKRVGAAEVYFGVVDTATNVGDDGANIVLNTGDDKIRYYSTNEGVNSNGYVTPVCADDTWFDIKIEVIATDEVVYHLTDGTAHTITTNNPDDLMGLHMYEGSGACEQEFSFGREYAAIPPTSVIGDPLVVEVVDPVIPSFLDICIECSATLSYSIPSGPD